MQSRQSRAELGASCAHQEPRWDSLLHFSMPWHSLFQLPDQGLAFFRYGKAGLQPPPSLHHPSISFPSLSSASAPSRGVSQHRAGKFSVLCLAWLGDREPLVLPALVGWVISTGMWIVIWGMLLGILNSPTLLGSNRAGRDGHQSWGEHRLCCRRLLVRWRSLSLFLIKYKDYLTVIISTRWPRIKGAASKACLGGVRTRFAPS